jgi:hypothetical protein
VKADYWNVADELILEKTGKPAIYWTQVLEAFAAEKKNSNDVVGFLQARHQVPRYWARTLTTRYLKSLAAG